MLAAGLNVAAELACEGECLGGPVTQQRPGAAGGAPGSPHVSEDASEVDRSTLPTTERTSTGFRQRRWSQSLPAVLLAWAAGRATLVLIGLQYLPYPNNDLVFNDVRLYAEWAVPLAEGRIPASDLWQYPPLAGVVFLAGTWLSDPFHGFLVVSLIADLLLLGALILAARRRDRWSGVWLWVAAAPIIGPILVGRFDIIPALFAVTVVLWARRPWRAGALAAAGALVKVWPVFTLVAVRRRDMPRALLSAALVGLGLLVGLSVWFSGALSFLSGQTERGLQAESVAAFPFVLANAGPWQVAFTYRFGSQEVDASGAGAAAVLATLAGLAAAGWVAWTWFQGRFDRLPPADVAYTVVLLSVVVSRVFSPQYYVWLVALGALVVADPRSRLRRSVVLVCVGAAVTQLIYPWGYGEMLAGSWYAVLLQTVRIVLTLVATVIAVRGTLLAHRIPAVARAGRSGGPARSNQADATSPP